MLEGKNIVELSKEILRRAGAKKDYLAPTDELKATSSRTLVLPEGIEYPITSYAHNQISQRLDIPKKYYDRILLKYPQLWAVTVNKLFKKEPERRMIRTLDGQVRAFLSDRYRRLENEDIAEVIIPILMEYSGLIIQSTEITDRRMYISAVYPKLVAEVKPGDIIQAGLQISNSEIGAGTWEASYFSWRLSCSNGMKFKELGIRQAHVGRKVEEEGELSRFYSDETRELDDRAIISKTKDIVKALLDGSSFGVILNKLRQSTEDTVKNIPGTVELIATNYQLSEKESESALENIIREGNLNRYGIANGISFAANESTDYDRMIELQGIGGKIIDLAPEQWSKLKQ
jgi:hypothetical protein